MNESFYKVSSELLSRLDITAFDKLLVSVLYSRNKFFRDNGQLHYDKLSDLAEMLGASRRTVERSLAESKRCFNCIFVFFNVIHC